MSSSVASSFYFEAESLSETRAQQLGWTGWPTGWLLHPFVYLPGAGIAGAHVSHTCFSMWVLGCPPSGPHVCMADQSISPAHLLSLTFLKILLPLVELELGRENLK